MNYTLSTDELLTIEQAIKNDPELRVRQRTHIIRRNMLCVVAIKNELPLRASVFRKRPWTSKLSHGLNDCWPFTRRRRLNELVVASNNGCSTRKQALRALTPPRGRDQRHWQELAAILRRHWVEGLLSVNYQLEVERQQVRAYRNRPAQVEERYR